MRPFILSVFAIFQTTSVPIMNAEDSSSRNAGIHHPLARSTGAGEWSAGRNLGVPGGLIWRSATEKRGGILCLHGIQTHAAWFGPLANDLRRNGWTVIAPDRRGSGVNSSAPYRKGHTTGARELLDDLDVQMELARKEAGEKPLLLLGTSWGSNLAGAWLASTSQPLPDGFIQLVPATRSHFDPGPFKRILVGTMNLVAKTRTKEVPFSPEDYLPIGQNPDACPLSWKILVADGPNDSCKGGKPSKWEPKHGTGVLLTHPTFGTLQAGLTLNRRARGMLANGIPVPLLVIQASGDQIMRNEESWNSISIENRNSGVGTRVILDGGHGIQLDEPEEVANAILRWWSWTK